MFTIDRLAKIDTIATRIIAAMHRGTEWVRDHYEDFLVDTTYRVVEAKAAAIDKAAEALVAANKDYDATIRAANEKLGVEVDA